MGILDMMMFSINPAYDYRKGEYGIGNVEERMALYRRCEKEGIGISVMKAFGAGQLLNEKTSPFGKALTEYQCIQYALDKPGVVTVLPGIRGKEDLKRILKFLRQGLRKKIILLSERLLHRMQKESVFTVIIASLVQKGWMSL